MFDRKPNSPLKELVYLYTPNKDNIFAIYFSRFQQKNIKKGGTLTPFLQKYLDKSYFTSIIIRRTWNTSIGYNMRVGQHG